MSSPPGQSLGEALTTVGLVLNVTAAPAFIIGLTTLSITASVFAAATMAIAVVTFVVSLVCLVVGGRRLDECQRAAHPGYFG
jgi:hypothetical protein